MTNFLKLSLFAAASALVLSVATPSFAAEQDFTLSCKPVQQNGYVRVIVRAKTREGAIRKAMNGEPYGHERGYYEECK